jgi:aspartyl-tRNA(Asn)/glutamyl-tRNA(Gln) amidotransferase subunit A
MSMGDLAFAGVAELSAALGSRRVASVDLVEALLERIRHHDGRLHAFVAVYADDARLAAEAADRATRAGHRVGPLHGVPVALKDLVELEGRVTTGGSAAWRDRVSPVTATLARRLVEAGMIVLGKTHTVEFAMGGFGTNAHLGTPRNPWDVRVHRTPGGSSSGSGVAVAAGLVPAAIGTDTGGSVRLPAAWCGIVGLKVTVGRISTHGVLPLSATLDTPGPMARSVEDAALLFRVLQGPDAHDSRTRLEPPVDPVPTLRRGVAGLRLGLLADSERDGVEPDVLAAYDAAVETLRRLGASAEPAPLPRTSAEYVAATGRIMTPEAYHVLGRLAEDPALPLDPHVRARVLQGRGVSARDYLDALARQAEDRQAYAAATAGLDALLTPTVRTPAIPVSEVDETTTPAHFTRMANYLGACALALPDGFTRDGLPCSLQIVGRAFDEATVLRIGWAYEQATDWHQRRPPES